MIEESKRIECPIITPAVHISKEVCEKVRKRAKELGEGLKLTDSCASCPNNPERKVEQ